MIQAPRIKNVYLLVNDLLNDDWVVVSHAYTICKCIISKMDPLKSNFKYCFTNMNTEETYRYLGSCLECGVKIHTKTFGSLAMEFILCEKDNQTRIRMSCRIMCQKCHPIAPHTRAFYISTTSEFTVQMHKVFLKYNADSDWLLDKKHAKRECFYCDKTILEYVKDPLTTKLNSKDLKKLLHLENFCSEECRILFSNMDTDKSQHNYDRNLRLVYTMLSKIPLHEIVPEDLSPFCYNCKKELEDKRFCTKCLIAVYCGPNCQRVDWKIHKTWCSEVSNQWSDFNPIMRQ